MGTESRTLAWKLLTPSQAQVLPQKGSQPGTFRPAVGLQFLEAGVWPS